MGVPDPNNVYQHWSHLTPDGRIISRGLYRYVADVGGGSMTPQQVVDLWIDKGVGAFNNNQGFQYMKSNHAGMPRKIAALVNSELCLMPKLTPSPNRVGNALVTEVNWSANTNVAPSEEHQEFVFVAVN